MGKTDPLSHYSVQRWLETVPQGYLADTRYGHTDSLCPLHINDAKADVDDRALRLTVQLILGERCALAVSSALINATASEANKRFLATQTLDEARHVEMFTHRLFELGVNEDQLDDCLKSFGSLHLLRFSEVLLERVYKGDFLAAIVGQNIILEGLSYTVFDVLERLSRNTQPQFAQMLTGAIADERRHMGFGEKILHDLIAHEPERKPDLEALQAELSHHILGTFSELLRDGGGLQSGVDAPCAERSAPALWNGRDLASLDSEELDKFFAEQLLQEFEKRLSRLGLHYREPLRL
jgi:ribosomal protein S18 acetylase RimI-like enzyme